MASLVLAVVQGGAAGAQSPGTGPAPSDACAAWGAAVSAAPLRAPAASRRVLALAEGAPCTLEHVRVADAWSSPAATRLFGMLGATDGWRRSDAPADAFRLDGAALTGTVDPATDLTSLAVAPLTLDRKHAAALAKRLTAAVAKPRPDLVVGLPLSAAQLVKPGGYQLILLGTAADPTTVPAAIRYYQLAHAGDPSQTLPGTFGADADPLVGARWLITFTRSLVDGTAQSGAGLSDFFDAKLGPDGKDQLYNASPTYATFLVPDGIAFLVPDRVAGHAVRATTFDSASGAWDLAGAPDGPLALLPYDGRASGAFDLVQLGLDHTAVTQPSGSLGGSTFTDRSFPSHQEIAFLVDPAQRQAIATLDLLLDVDGQALELPGLVPEATPTDGRTALVFRFGIPTYGRYRLDGVTGHAADGTPTDLTAEVQRALGFDSWQVDSTPGAVSPTLLSTYLLDQPGGFAYRQALLGGAWDRTP
ncbi:MAG: hypothetical protein U0869_09815 [Chloroflexota bacterium]